ncbi:MAG: hypothetical protein ACREO6_09535 [Rudaea sp.]
MLWSTRTAVRALLAFALPFAAAPVSAEPVPPPLELLHAPGNFLIVGTVAEINPEGRVVFERKEVLSDKPGPPALVDVRVPASVLASAKPGERYIVGYSMYRPNARLGKMLANPDGPTLLASLGLEPALFHDTPAIRAILDAGRSEHGRESRRFYDLIMQALGGGDPQLQNLAAGEIALDRELFERVRKDGLAGVEQAARDPKTSVPARLLLLQTAATHAGYLGGWATAAAKEIVENTPVDGYSGGTSDLPGLVLAALEVLDMGKAEISASSLQRWLHAANTALVEQAVVMLRRVSAATERSAVADALSDPHLPAQSRVFLEDRLRRLDGQAAAAKAQKEGSD